jgi:para-nitrobenzyl esterase
MGLANASAADLRRLTPEKILNSPGPDIRAGATSMIDGRILTTSVGDAFARGIEARIPYIIGYNELEMPLPENLVDTMLAKDPMMSAPARARIEAAYPDRDTYLSHVVSDLIFTEPALHLARLHARHAPTWVYRFSVLSVLAPANLKGAPHASDRQYVFSTLKASTWPTNANDAVQADAISAYWTSFARQGDPNGGDRPHWPTYDPTRDELLDFTNGGPVVTVTPHRRALDAFSALYHE